MPSPLSGYSQAVTGAGRTAGVAEAAGQLANYVSPVSQANRAEARLRKEQMEQQLATAKATRMTSADHKTLADTQSQQLRTALQESQMANAELAKRTTFDSFQKYESDGDVRHLNNALTDLGRNPLGSRLFPNVVRVEKITQNDTQLLRQIGIDWEILQTQPEILKEFLKTVNKDGTVGIVAMEELYAGTGYTQYLTAQELDNQEKRAKIFQMTRAQSAAARSEVERTAHTMTLVDKPANFEGDWSAGNPEYDYAYLQNLEEARSQTRTVTETQDEAEASRLTRLLHPDNPEWRPGNTEYDAAYQDQFESVKARNSRTSAQKELANVRDIKQNIRQRVSETPGVTSFFDIDFSKMENRLEYEEDIREIERLGGLEMPAADRQSIHHIRELLTLGDTAKDLTARETGLIDRTFKDIKRYFSDDIQGLDMSASYATFRNTLQHALFGSALTANEIGMMVQQFGTLGMQRGPVLAQFQVALQQVRDKLSSVKNMGDSYVSHFYLGQDTLKLDDMITAIDESIQQVEKANGGESPDVYVRDAQTQQVQQAPVAAPIVSPEVDALYEEIYGNNQ